MEEINRKESWSMVDSDRYSFLENALEKRQLAPSGNNHPTVVSRQHDHDDRSSVEHQGLDTNTSSSKVTITAGITVFVLGMLILITTAGYFLAKGRFWVRATKKSKSEELESGDGVGRPRLETEPVFVVGEVEETELRTIMVVSADSKISPAPENHIATNTTAKEQITESTPTLRIVTKPETLTFNNQDINSQPSSSQQMQVYMVEQSPSTAKLIEPQAASVFAFLKGNNYHAGSHMPALTRTKARSSIKYKGKSRIFPQARLQTRSTKPLLALPPQPTTTTTTATTTSTRSSFESNISTRTKAELALVRTASSSSSSLTTCDSRSVHSLQRNIFSPIRPSRISRRSAFSSSSTLRLDFKNTCSSSVMALFGSPRSSPGSSVGDGASIQAMYCPSLKSTMSLVANAESQDHNQEEERLPTPATNIQV
ncbi:hypothetical protein BGZ52_012111 [Haplosporangium bisporale]|nr:hypothetical protein BGZ52_012111 [Haplosporangium bisporale]